MGKSMKAAKYITTIIAMLFFITYILKIAEVGPFTSLGNWVLLPFWILIAFNMILILITQRKAKDSEGK